ncbi:hypothetical protein [Streptococcus sp. S784/96/1]|uniref:hypothetical protein n=1 Tax=Streptococcus sp. S784/96/1 TaxID=2653499 RepID=UPI003FCF0DA2
MPLIIPKYDKIKLSIIPNQKGLVMPSQTPRKPIGWGPIIGLIVVFAIFSEDLIPLLLFLGAGYGVYYSVTRKSALENKNTALRLQDLKETISQCDRQIKLLESYLDDKNFTQYSILAKQILPNLATIKSETDALKSKIDLNIYKRIMKRAGNEEDKINIQLRALNISTDTSSTSEQEVDILTRAPEIVTTYQNIQRDHMEILEKLKNAENASELKALHDINMQRFKDILDGYLKIKETPKNYYNADERLAQAKTALEKFDKNLDETLRQLNESQLSDFEISLRMMEEKTQSHSSDTYS